MTVSTTTKNTERTKLLQLFFSHHFTKTKKMTMSNNSARR